MTDELFDNYAAGSGSQGIVGGQTWAYANGQFGNVGDVIGGGVIIQDGRGKGLQIIPSPVSSPLGKASSGSASCPADDVSDCCYPAKSHGCLKWLLSVLG